MKNRYEPTSVKACATGGSWQRSLMPAWNSPKALTSRIGLGSRSDLVMWTKVTSSSSRSVVYRKPSGLVR